MSQTQPSGECSPQEQLGLNKVEVRNLRNFLGILEKPKATGTSSLELLGKTLSYALNILDKIHLSSEVIDLKATDYMIYNS